MHNNTFSKSKSLLNITETLLLKVTVSCLRDTYFYCYKAVFMEVSSPQCIHGAGGHKEAHLGLYNVTESIYFMRVCELKFSVITLVTFRLFQYLYHIHSLSNHTFFSCVLSDVHMIIKSVNLLHFCTTPFFTRNPQWTRSLSKTPTL